MGPLVLIVDDNERNAKLARDVLEAAGMSTLSAATALDGLLLAREHRPDLVLLDLRLPDLGGLEAARRLRADGTTADIPVVALSATRIDDARSGEECFDGYIEKPIDVGEFPAQVRRHCTRTRPPRTGKLPP
ncbi:MAG: response regulator [Candidatus Rokuibacteriota bacterium]|nr:MAG: response regulator [Candidatus Rokubacteria bacterium]